MRSFDLRDEWELSVEERARRPLESDDERLAQLMVDIMACALDRDEILTSERQVGILERFRATVGPDKRADLETDLLRWRGAAVGLRERSKKSKERLTSAGARIPESFNELMTQLREIGQAIADNGGSRRMTLIAYRALALSKPATPMGDRTSIIEAGWNGIAGWRA